MSGLKQVLGSPLYMAPEIVAYQSYNSKVDIWSVGCITHILLTGCPPFFGKSKQEIYDAILNSQPQFGRVKSRLSRRALEFTLLCLQKDASVRPTAAELLHHPFITENVAGASIDAKTATDIATDLTTFYKQSIFQTGVISFLTGVRL